MRDSAMSELCSPIPITVYTLNLDFGLYLFNWKFLFTGLNYDDELIDNLHLTFKENAMFLLDLASTSGGKSITEETYSKSGSWVVGEFKCLGNLEVSAKQQSDSDDALLLQLRDNLSTGVSDIHFHSPFKIKIIKFFIKRYL